ncbi:MAG: hypothetical protein HYU99_07610 [Deltaproteobacteria bacterium]|nr:hypothetical protein [Deltaproteobacteria bacterium]
MEHIEQANFRLSREVLKSLRKAVPHGRQSRFVEEAIQKEIKRRQFLKAVESSFGAWGERKDLGTTRQFIRKLRRGRRLKSVRK